VLQFYCNKHAKKKGYFIRKSCKVMHRHTSFMSDIFSDLQFCFWCYRYNMKSNSLCKADICWSKRHSGSHCSCAEEQYGSCIGLQRWILTETLTDGVVQSTSTRIWMDCEYQHPVAHQKVEHWNYMSHIFISSKCFSISFNRSSKCFASNQVHECVAYTPQHFLDSYLIG
jgi:hypothetical protein